MSSTTTRMLRMAAVAIALVACTSDRVMGPSSIASPAGALRVTTAVMPAVRISEFHYDNDGTDAGEAIEVSGPAGTDLTGWQVVRYNGNTATAAAVYTSPGALTPGSATLSGPIPATCGDRGVVVLRYAANGLQNGPRDGFALVDASGQVVELLSYAGTFTAGGGQAVGMTSRDVGVTEASNAPLASSIQRTPEDTWAVSSTNTFGACNDNGTTVVAGPLASITIAPPTASIVAGSSQTFTASGFDAAGVPTSAPDLTWSTPTVGIVTVNPSTGTVHGDAIGDAMIVATSGSVTAQAIVHVVAPPPPPSDLPATRFSEIHYDNSGTDANEAIEVEGPAGVDVTGWSVVLYNGSASSTTGAPAGSLYGTRALSGAFTNSCNGRGVLVLSYPQDGLQNGGGASGAASDGFALVNAAGAVVQFLSYEGTVTAVDGPAAGLTSTDLGAEESSSTTAVQSLALNTAGAWERKTATFGAVNACADATGSASISISANGPDTLVVGWQRRAFVTYRDANGTTVTPTPTVTWTSDTPDKASVDARGYVTALQAGTAIVRAAIGTTTKTYQIAVIDYEPVTAQYRNHVEFGMPTGADPANDVLLTKPAFITSYNPARGGPNWVSWNINASTFGDAERCECFSGDAALPASQRIVDFDYVGGGYDRGHMVQSESRTSTHSENAASFLLTNILPQAANNNQGPWLGFENFLNDRARTDGRQVYVVAGGEYAASPTTLKNEGKVAIPDYTWKVAIVMNNGLGLADVNSPDDITVYAIRIPNLLATAPAKNNNYAPFVTTIDDIETRTGYDFFAALPDDVERIVESNDHRPTAVITGDASGVEGGTLHFDATSSSDQDVGTALNDVLSYQWSVNGTVRSITPLLDAVFTDDGQYAVQLIVSDLYGWADTTTRTVTIANVAPTLGSIAGATIIRGESYGASGAFTDPGADSWSATVNYGDGSGTQPLALSGTSFTLSHAYATAGTFTVTVTVTDDDGGTSVGTATVVVASASDAVGTLSGTVRGLVTAGSLTGGEAAALDASLRSALNSLGSNNPIPARNQLEAFINKVDAMQRSGRLSASDASALVAYARRIIASID